MPAKKPTAKKTAPKKTAAKKPSANQKLSRELVAKGQKYYMKNYKPREMILDRGRGSRVWDLEGKEYIDLGAGIAVSALGHHNDELLSALITQAKKLWHTSNIFFSAPPVLLAEELVKASKFARRVFLCNSGGEANEAAIKLARKHSSIHHADNPNKRDIITFTGSFHGRTLATVTATAQPKYQQGFEPLPQGFRYCPYNDFDAIALMVNENTCAVMLEVVQGEGGIVPVKPGFLKHVQALCHKHDALLMLDQVQCGMGRTGRLFSHFAEPGVKPDVVTLAKALGGGMPVGAMLVGAKAEESFQFGSHGSTFGGNPLAASVARVVLKKLQSKALLNNVEARSKQLREGLSAIHKKHKIFAEVRGRGLMIGAELIKPLHGKSGDISEAARHAGVLVLQAGPNVMRFLPPLNITAAEMREGIKRFEKAIEGFLKNL